MRNKKVLIITTLFVLFSSCYSKNSVNKDVQDYYVNQSRIIGTSHDGNLLGILLQKRNTGKADIISYGLTEEYENYSKNKTDKIEPGLYDKKRIGKHRICIDIIALTW